MSDYVFDDGIAFSSTKAALDWYKKQYYMMLEENKLLTDELKALIRQVHELQRVL